LVVDCQSSLLEALTTRLVAPLLPVEEAPERARRLNPVFEIGGRDLVMFSQFAAAVEVRELGEVVASLSDKSFEIVGALDVLISGV
jgi:toxin CcdB